jgi:mannose-6-phosphate isomerase
VLGDLLARDRGARETLVSQIVAACAAPPEGFERECAWAVRLAAKYPGDVGVVSALLLNLLHLAPGEALYLDAGNLHAYLHGVGVELMAASDNVLRGGLTQKHMDERELLSVLDFSAIEARPVPVLQSSPEERTYETPAREFCLSRLEVGGDEVRRPLDGPEIWLATRHSGA